MELIGCSPREIALSCQFLQLRRPDINNFRQLRDAVSFADFKIFTSQCLIVIDWFARQLGLSHYHRRKISLNKGLGSPQS